MMKTSVEEQRRNAISKGVERICSNHVEWYLEGKGHRLWDVDIEHIQNMLIDNRTAGELYSITPDDHTVYGWWNIQM